MSGTGHGSLTETRLGSHVAAAQVEYDSFLSEKAGLTRRLSGYVPCQRAWNGFIPYSR